VQLNVPRYLHNALIRDQSHWSGDAK
jgi:hypothetical protein